MLKPDPNIRRLRWLGILWIVVGALNTLDYILAAAVFHARSVNWWNLFLGAYFILLGILLLVTGPGISRRLDRRRRLAAHGDVGEAPLAVQQPDWDANALALPLTIVLKPNWRPLATRLLLGCVLIVLAAALAYAIAVHAAAPAHPLQQVLSLALVARLVVLAGLVALLLFGIVYVYSRQRIVATEDGLTVHAPGRTEAIRWDEAHLFAIVNMGRPRKPLPPLMYELSGEHSVVRWYRLWPEQKLGFMVPLLPWPEYEQQMEALLRVVAGKTHLPLHDLREPPRPSAHGNRIQTR